MLRSRQFSLCKDTIAVLMHGCTRQLVHIPCGSTVTLLNEPAQEDGMVRIVWEGKMFRMFLVDIEERGEFFEDRATA